MKEFFKERASQFVVLITVTLLLFLVIPVLLDVLVFENDFPCKVSNDGWASFFGSFCGGIATLFAVLFTIEYNSYENAKKQRDEDNRRIEKSATIIYYDFMFAFESIRDFCRAATLQALLSTEDKVKRLSQYKALLNQLYIDSGWIHNVADLKGCEAISSQDIEVIYRTYGNLNSIIRWKEYDTDMTRWEAAIALSDVMEFLNLDWEVKKDIKWVLETLESVGKIKQTIEKPQNDETKTDNQSTDA